MWNRGLFNQESFTALKSNTSLELGFKIVLKWSSTPQLCFTYSKTPHTKMRFVIKPFQTKKFTSTEIHAVAASGTAAICQWERWTLDLSIAKRTQGYVTMKGHFTRVMWVIDHTHTELPWASKLELDGYWMYNSCTKLVFEGDSLVLLWITNTFDTETLQMVVLLQYLFQILKAEHITTWVKLSISAKNIGKVKHVNFKS